MTDEWREFHCVHKYSSCCLKSCRDLIWRITCLFCNWLRSFGRAKQWSLCWKRKTCIEQTARDSILQFWERNPWLKLGTGFCLEHCLSKAQNDKLYQKFTPMLMSGVCFRCLLFTRDWDWNFWRYCHSRR